MVKKELSETEIAESIPDLWQPLTDAQKDYLAQNFTIQKYKKNETIYCEGETPKHLMCLLKGKGYCSSCIRALYNMSYPNDMYSKASGGKCTAWTFLHQTTFYRFGYFG